jgi:hypothetical protein
MGLFGKKNPPPEDDNGGEEPKKNSAGLMMCPNFNDCQTWVLPAKRGLAHKYGYLVDGEIQYKNCSGG